MDKDSRKDKASPPREGKATLLTQGLRVLRLAESLGLKPETLKNLRDALLPKTAKDGTEVQAPSQEAQPASYPAIERIAAEGTRPAATKDSAPIAEKPKAAEAAMKAKAGATSSKVDQSAGKTSQKTLDLALDAEMRLRRKIEAEQSWTAFRVEAWQLYESFPRPEMAARISELAFLYGSVNELEDVLSSLSKQSVEFLPLLELQMHSHMIVKLWQGKRFQLLDSILFRKEIALRLQPVERLYCCWSYIERGQVEQAYRFYRRYEQELVNAQKHYGTLVRKQSSELALVIGRAALQMEDESLAVKLLESIPQDAHEFQKALDLLLDLHVERDEAGFCAYGQKLNRELDWKARVGLFDSFLIRIQRVENGLPRERAALNALLADPLKWVPESPEAWQMMAELLLQYSKLEPLLPNILKTFSDRAVQYHKPSYEHALWAPVLDHDFGNPVRTWFWRSIALMHEFVWGLGQDETRLWEARRVYLEASAHHGKALPISWQTLHRALLQWIQKSERLNEILRNKLLLAAKLVGETRDLSEQDISAYLTNVPMPSAIVLDLLETLARERQQWGLELFILDRKAAIYHHTNQSLDRLWELGAQLKRPDLCWRAATLLKARTVMRPELDRHWAISGEKRRDFPINDLTDAHVKRIVQSFEGYERKLVESLLSVGPLIPELLAGLHQHLVPLKKTKDQSVAEEQAQEALDKASWLFTPKKMFSPNPSGLWQPKPLFFSNLIDSKWSMIFVGLAQRLGLTVWEWQLSLLNQQIENLVPKMTRGVEETATGKVGRWLRNLTPQQRKSWYEFAQMPKRFDDEKAQEILGRFLVRLTTAMHQDHLMALRNLEKMRAPLRLRWDLENWIVSEAYGDIRKSLASHASGQFPEDVYRMKPSVDVPSAS